MCEMDAERGPATSPDRVRAPFLPAERTDFGLYFVGMVLVDRYGVGVEIRIEGLSVKFRLVGL